MRQKSLERGISDSLGMHYNLGWLAIKIKEGGSGR